MCNTLQYEVGKLDGTLLTGLMDRLDKLEEDQVTRDDEIKMNDDDITAIISSLETLEADIPVLNANAVTARDMIGDPSNLVDPADNTLSKMMLDNEEADDKNTADTIDIENDWLKQKITGDFFFEFAGDDIEVDLDEFDLPGSCFTLDEDSGAAMEFYFTGAFAPNTAGGAQINAVLLLEDDVKVAASEFTSDPSSVVRDFDLFYKTKIGAGDDFDYKIRILSNAGTVGATIPISSH